MTIVTQDSRFATPGEVDLGFGCSRRERSGQGNESRSATVYRLARYNSDYVNCLSQGLEKALGLMLWL